MTIRIVLDYDKEVDAWAAYCPEIPGLTSCGKTEAEAAENFREAAELYFDCWS